MGFMLSAAPLKDIYIYVLTCHSVVACGLLGMTDQSQPSKLPRVLHLSKDNMRVLNMTYDRCNVGVLYYSLTAYRL